MDDCVGRQSCAKKSQSDTHMKTSSSAPKNRRGLLKRIINGHSNKGDLVADFSAAVGLPVQLLKSLEGAGSWLMQAGWPLSLPTNAS